MEAKLLTAQPHELSDHELAYVISDRYRAYGFEWMQPNIRTQNEHEQALHNRIERVQSVPLFAGDVITESLIKEYSNSKSLSDSQRPADIDKLFNSRGQSAASEGFLKEMKLSRVEQILLLRGVVLATDRRRLEAERGESRFSYSNNQQRLNLAARCTIHDMATNPVRLSENGDQEQIRRFTASYVTSYIAKLVEREVSVDELPEQYNRSSIKGAMTLEIPFGTLREKQPDRAVSIFTIQKYESDEDAEPFGFRAVHRTEIDPQRLAGLAEVQASYDDKRVAFTYFDTIRPFQVVERPEEDDGPRKPKITLTPREELGDDIDEEEYVVLEIEGVDEEDRTQTHVVAENNTVKNACYVLRQEVLDHWKDIFDIDFKWQNVLLSTKRGARQMGAKKMDHAKGSNVPKRVVDYLQSDSEEAVLEAFAFLFDGMNMKQHRKGVKHPDRFVFFDDDMEPTKHNKLKPALIAKIQSSQDLQTVWPLIRTHGYKKAYHILKAAEAHASGGQDQPIAQKSKQVKPKNQPTKTEPSHDIPFAERVNDIWDSVIAEVIEDL